MRSAAGRRWVKQGLVFEPDTSVSWMQSHAALPLTLALSPNRSRVFFASRDAGNRSHVGFVDVEINDGALQVVEGPQPEPSLEPGPLGHFDSHGVYPASIVRGDDGRLWLYYIGWNPGTPPPMFYSSIGLAFSDDDGRSFQKHGVAPLMARGVHDPCLVTSPCVMRDGALWRMWYVSGLRWEEHEGALLSFYHLKYAQSDDGLDWVREGRVAIDLAHGERNIARPCVIRDGDGYRMWFSYDRGEGYRIGYADSPDGLEWRRDDAEAGIAPSREGWDSEAQAYPWVASIGGRQVMFYNGNANGRDGFGAAMLE